MTEPEYYCKCNTPHTQVLKCDHCGLSVIEKEKSVDEGKLAECISNYMGDIHHVKDLARYLKDNQKEFLT